MITAVPPWNGGPDGSAEIVTGIVVWLPSQGNNRDEPNAVVVLVRAEQHVFIAKVRIRSGHDAEDARFRAVRCFIGTGRFRKKTAIARRFVAVGIEHAHLSGEAMHGAVDKRNAQSSRCRVE